MKTVYALSLITKYVGSLQVLKKHKHNTFLYETCSLGEEWEKCRAQSGLAMHNSPKEAESSKTSSKVSISREKKKTFWAVTRTLS